MIMAFPGKFHIFFAVVRSNVMLALDPIDLFIHSVREEVLCFIVICFRIHMDIPPASVAQLDAPSDWRPGGRGFNPLRSRQHSFVIMKYFLRSVSPFR